MITFPPVEVPLFTLLLKIVTNFETVVSYICSRGREELRSEIVSIFLVFVILETQTARAVLSPSI